MDIKLMATANVKVTKLDESGKVISIEEHSLELSREEAEKLWHSQQQE